MSRPSNFHHHAKKLIDAINHLLQDDFIEAALMLTYTGIDQMSWINTLNEEADSNDFKAWVTKYIDPVSNLGCTSDDLWGARNGLLHTSTAESRDFRKNKIKKIYYFYGKVQHLPEIDDDTILVDAKQLVISFIAGTCNFSADLEADLGRQEEANLKAGAILAFRVIG